MSLWGKFDKKSADSGTVQIFANGLVTGTSTIFDDEAAVGDFIVTSNDADGQTKYLITSIESNTECHVASQELGLDVAAVAAGNTYSFQEAPKYVAASHAGGAGDGANDVFGLANGEVGAQDGPVLSAEVTFAGSAYGANATVAIGGTGSSATANSEANTSGKIETVNITAGGTDYTTGSTTVTIDPPAAISFNALTAVSNTDETITLSDASFIEVGDKLTYAVASGNTAVGGLDDGTQYFVSFANDTVVALSTTNGGANIDLTAGVTETGHTLTGETATAAATVGGAGIGTHAGWVKRTVGTGGRAGRVQYETLVAGSSIVGDQEDDITPDS
jgi:hypothetical protein